LRKFILLLVIALTFQTTNTVASADVWKKVAKPDSKGYVLLLRHAVAPGTGDPANFSIGDCSTQRNLSEEGIEQARKIGNWLKAKQVLIHKIESSRWCRAADTAKLMNIGKVIENSNLHSLFQDDDPESDKRTTATLAQIKKHRKTAGLLVLVFHQVNITALTGIAPASGEGILVRAKKGKIEVVGRSPAL